MRQGDGENRPVVCILDPSTATTGALIAARRQAELLSDRARFVMILPENSIVGQDQLTAFEAVERIPLHPLRRNAKSAALYVPRLIRSARALARVLRAHDCTRLQVNDFYLPQAKLAHLFGYRGRTITWVRCDHRRLGIAGKWWLAQARRSSNAIIAVSQHIAANLPESFRARVIYDPAPIVRPVEPHGQNFLFVGNYIDGKGQDVALRAFHSIISDFPEARLTFAGSTMGLEKNRSYRARLEQAATAGPGSSRVAFLDFQHDLDPLYTDALAAINCSTSESFSFTCLEASARGLPVLATRCGGPEEIIDDGSSGYLIDVGDSEALAAKMRLLLGDEELARRLGARGASLVRERFAVEPFRRAVASALDL
jgi:glycosyltransferase involved in cell wall biosynthesis